MGINDRDYSRNAPSGGFGNFRPYSITTWLIAVNVGVFMADGLLMRMNDSEFLSYGGPLMRSDIFRHHRRLSLSVLAVHHLSVSSQFRRAHFLEHDRPVFFWPDRGKLSRRPTLSCILSFLWRCGALMYILLWACHILVDNPATPLVGWGIFGIIIAAANSRRA